MSRAYTPHFTDVRGKLIDLPGEGIILASLKAAPTASAAGYAKGCVFIDRTNGNVYKNTGTVTSATWTAILTGAQGAALTAAAADTVDGTYGTEEATVIANMRTRLGEIEARLEAAGIVAAN